MRISGRHAVAATTLSSLLALQVAAPASATVEYGRGAAGALTVPAFPHRAVALPAQGQRVKLLYRLPLRNEAQLERLTQLQATPGSQVYHRWLTPQQFQANFAPDAGTVAAAVQALRASGLSVDRVGHQVIRVSAPVATIERNFGTHLEVARYESGSSIVARDSYRIPAALARLPGTLLGLTAHPRPRVTYHSVGHVIPQNRYGPVGGYWFDDLKQAYRYPIYSQANGSYKTAGGTVEPIHIGVVGYSDFNESDAYNAFAHEDVGNFGGALATAPILTHTNFPGSNPWSAGSSASFEADLDVQESGGSAPGAEIDAWNADASYNEGFLATYAQIVEDNADDIVSTSYGGCELAFTAAYNGGVDSTGILQAYHDVFLEGNAYGITFVFSSGDDAGLGCYPLTYYQQHSSPVTVKPIAGAQFWANDPAVTGVGGTNLTTTYVKNSLDSGYVSEQAIADYPRATQDPYGTGNEVEGLYWGSGGGVSRIWAQPSYQAAAAKSLPFKTAGRLTPDISMHMGGCPGDVLSSAPCLKTEGQAGSDSYDIVGHDGLFYGLIGTSASAPEFAGLLAVFEGYAQERLGNVNPLLYALGKPPYVHQGIQATDGVSQYAVAKGKLGYNLITGLGTPDVVPFLDAFTGKKFAAAGLPQTASNP